MAAEKGLGRGLGVLFGEAAVSEDLDSVYLPLSKVESTQSQPRHIFDDVTLGELADSIKQHGVIQPLTVRKLNTGNYEIVAGERRWRAARLAGLDKVPVRIIEADDQKAAELALVENLQREDLNAVEEAKGFQALADAYYFTQDQIAESIGKSRAYISNSMRILQLPDYLLELIEDNSLSAGHAKAILTLKDHALQMMKLVNEIRAKSLTVRDAEQRAREILANISEVSEKPKPDKTKTKIFLDDMASRLESEIGRKVKISGNGKNGSVTLEYYSKDDLDALFEYLKTAKK